MLCPGPDKSNSNQSKSLDYSEETSSAEIDASKKKVAYKTLVLQILEYCQTIWDPHQQNKIDTERYRTAKDNSELGMSRVSKAISLLLQLSSSYGIWVDRS